jgi:hypothetical protein
MGVLGSRLKRALRPLVRKRVRELKRGSGRRGERGVSSVLGGILVAVVLFGALGTIVFLRQLQTARVPGEVERQEQIQERIRERLEPAFVLALGENVTFRVRNSGDIAVQITGISRRLGDRLETTPFEAELAPNEERTFEASMGAFDALGLLTARGNLFSMTGANLGGIEFLVLDAETGEPIENASVEGMIFSDPIEVRLRTNERGLAVLRVWLPWDEPHSFEVLADALGYDENRLAGKITRTENRQIVIKLRYHPFDLELSENSGSLVQEWAPYTYQYRSPTTETTEEWVPYEEISVDDPMVSAYEADPNYKLEELGHYETRTREVTKYRTETIELSASISSWYLDYLKSKGWTVTANYEAVEYTKYHYDYVVYWGPSSNGPWSEVRTGTASYDSFKGQSFTTGPTSFTLTLFWFTITVWEKTEYTYTGATTETESVLVGYTATAEIPYVVEEEYQEWVRTGYRVLQRVKLITTTRYYRTDYSPRPWGSRTITLTVIPRNEYRGEVRLEALAPGIRATLGDPVLHLSSPAQTTLTLRPGGTALGTHRVALRALDHRGRLGAAREYLLSLSSPRPASYTWTREVTEEVGPEPPVRVPISMESFKSVTIIPDDAYTLPSEGYVTFAVVGGGYYPVTGVGFSGSLDDFFERAWEKAQRMYPELRPDYRIPVSI